MKLTGKVIRGEGIAERDFGIPTANLNIHPKNLAYGVYVGHIVHETNKYNGVICYGVGNPPKFEVHLFDYTGDLYGEKLKVDVGEKISELIEWTSLERMRQKILHDIETAKQLLKNAK